ncbi:MAG: tetratricopeptide repeat protein [Pseudomonadota bacterium]
MATSTRRFGDPRCPASLGAIGWARLGEVAVRFVLLTAILLGGLALPAGTASAQYNPSTGRVDLEAVDWSAIENDVPGFPGVPLFQMPRLIRETSVIAQAVQGGQGEAAMRMVERLILRYPLVADLHATRGLLLAQAGRIEAAITALDTALDLGYQQISQIRRAPAFAELTSHRQFRRIAGETRKPLPLRPVPARAAAVDGQKALISELNTRWDPQRQALSASFILPDDIDERRPIWDPRGEPGQRHLMGTVPEPGGALARLAERIRSGEAAGLQGVFYNNMDRDHASLNAGQFPRLTFIEYNAAAKAASIDFGTNRSLHVDGIVIGNSSTALTRGPFSRSHGRALMTGPGDMDQQMRQFVRNQLYVYPAVGDYAPREPTEGARAGRGDAFPALSPYFLMSEGVSHSDKPFLIAMATALAAMTPELRNELESRRLIAPTLQMILRRSLRGIGDDLDRYLTGAAHRPVLRGEDLDMEAVAAIAERLTAAEVPPMPVLVIDQDFDAQPGVELFGDGISERLFDTPFAAARVWRSIDHTRRMVLRAGVAERRPGQEVTFEWRVLQGMEGKVRLTPIGRTGERVAVEVDWHGRYPVPGREELTTDRVDIGLFARIGDEASTPAVLSIVFPPRQERRYEPGPDGETRLTAVDYAPDLPRGVYADPLVFAERRWRDFLDWDEDGTLKGWRRRHHDYRNEDYTAGGLLIRERDALGRPVLVEAMDYPSAREPKGVRVVDALPNGERFEILYPTAEAETGVMLPADREGLPDDAEEGTGLENDAVTGN